MILLVPSIAARGLSLSGLSTTSRHKGVLNLRCVGGLSFITDASNDSFKDSRKFHSRSITYLNHASNDSFKDSRKFHSRSITYLNHASNDPFKDSRKFHSRSITYLNHAFNDAIKYGRNSHRRAFSRSAARGRQMDGVFQRMMASENRTIEICKLINPRDANPLGRMHGGNVLSLLEEAGIIAATRHINSNADPGTPPCVAALARMEKVDFLHSISVGDVVEVDSEVTFTSDRSCEVSVTIEAISTMKGDMTRHLATTAHLWFVPVYQDKETGEQKTARMPPLTSSSREEAAAGRRRYEAQLAARSIYQPARTQLPVFTATTRGLFPKGTVRNSQLMMTHFVNVTDCDMFRNMRGGAIMKLADEACGSTAWLHSESICVTASVDACNFRIPITAGSSIFFDSYVTFTGTKSMEIEVVVHHAALNAQTMDVEIHHNSLNALYTFIPIDLKGKAKEVRPLSLETDFEREIFEQGRRRYQLRMDQRPKS